MAGEMSQQVELRIASYDESRWGDQRVSNVSPRSGPNSNVPDFLHQHIPLPDM